MPELAEVEYFRKQWEPGIGQKITAVAVRGEKRIFRGEDVALLASGLPGAKITESEARGKQMLFRFSNDIWLGLHLGMTGRLRLEAADFTPEKHDHLVLFQKDRTLVLQDARLFGRVRIHRGATPPTWWSDIPPAVISKEFTVQRVYDFLQRHARLPVKPALLLQDGFPGVGNWMADEILWRASLSPLRRCSELNQEEIRRLWKESRYVCREALRKVGHDFSDPPEGWLFHERWKRSGVCPKHHLKLRRQSVGGRTTAWCSKCQSGPE